VNVHRHGIVLVRPFFRASCLAAVGAACFLLPWPAAAAGAALLGVSALVMLAAVARWDSTRLELTPDALRVVGGVLRRYSASVALEGRAIEVEQTLLGRVLGYCTVVAGELEVEGVPRRVANALRQR
jgi:hypothetical protein